MPEIWLTRGNRVFSRYLSWYLTCLMQDKDPLIQSHRLTQVISSEFQRDVLTSNCAINIDCVNNYFTFEVIYDTCRFDNNCGGSHLHLQKGLKIARSPNLPSSLGISEIYTVSGNPSIWNPVDLIVPPPSRIWN